MDTSNLVRLNVAMEPAISEVVESARREFEHGLPAQLELLYQSCNGFLTPMGITVYDAESLLERNETYEAGIYSPGYTLIGDDSGGRGFLLSSDGNELAVFSSDLGDLAPEGFDKEADSLEAWISRLA